MNYSIPVYRAVIKLDDKHLSFFKEDVEDIIDQQLMITKLCSSISFKDTNDMDEYEVIYNDHESRTYLAPISMKIFGLKEVQ